MLSVGHQSRRLQGSARLITGARSQLLLNPLHTRSIASPRLHVRHALATPKITNAHARFRFDSVHQRQFVRYLSDVPVPRQRSRAWIIAYRAAAWFGSSIAFVGLGVVGFFLYDASTYKESGTHEEIDVARTALNPRRGGPKNLPILEAYLDDNESPTARERKEKPRLVILGGGWGGVAILKELNPEDWNVTVISPGE